MLNVFILTPSEMCINIFFVAFNIKIYIKLRAEAMHLPPGVSMSNITLQVQIQNEVSEVP